MSPRVALVLTALAAACSRNTGVLLTVRGGGLVADQLRIVATYDSQSVTRVVPDTPAPAGLLFPEDLFAQFAPQSRPVTFSVDALRMAQPVASADLAVQIEPNQILSATIDLSSVVATPPAPAPPPRMDLGHDLGPTDMTGDALPHVSYASVVLADAPLAYYRLGETTGTQALDSSGHGLHGTYGGMVTRGASGLIAGDADRAATFSGGTWSAAAIVTVPAASLLQPTQAVSIELWMRQPVFNADGTPLVVYGDWTSQQPSYGAQLFGKAFAVLMQTGAGPVGAPDFVTVTQPALNQTYHFVETYDGQNARLYVDGVLEATRPAAGPLVGYGGSGLGIGSVASSSVGDLVFAGTLDEVAIYGGALSPQRILAHYLAGSGKTHP